MRGYAIILVVVGHLIQMNITGGSALKCFNWIYSFHMPLFFFISGTVAGFSNRQITYNSAVKFVKGKFMVLCIPFVCWSCVIYPLIYKQISLDVYYTYLLDLFKNPRLGAWFLPLLFCVHVSYMSMRVISMRLSRYCNSKIAEGGGILIVLVLLVILHIKYDPVYISITYMLSYLMGVYFDKITFLFSHGLVVLGVVVIAAFLTPLVSSSASVSMYSRVYMVIIFIIIYYVSTLICQRSDNLVRRNICKLGRGSLEIYLVHTFFVNVIKTNPYNVDVNSIPLLAILMVIGWIIANVSITSAKILQTIPYINILLFGKKWKEKKLE